MKTTVLILAVWCAAAAMGGTATKDVEYLQAENALLKVMVKRLEKRVAELEVELQKLKTPPTKVEAEPKHFPKSPPTKAEPDVLSMEELISNVKLALSKDTTSAERDRIVGEAEGKKVRLDCTVKDVSGWAIHGPSLCLSADCISLERVLVGTRSEHPLYTCHVEATVLREQGAPLKRGEVVGIVGSITRMSAPYPTLTYAVPTTLPRGNEKVPSAVFYEWRIAISPAQIERPKAPE